MLGHDENFSNSDFLPSKNISETKSNTAGCPWRLLLDINLQIFSSPRCQGRLLDKFKKNSVTTSVKCHVPINTKWYYSILNEPNKHLLVKPVIMRI